MVVPGAAAAVLATTTAGGWSARPKTILVDSAQLESGEAMSADFKAIAAREIEEFKAEYCASASPAATPTSSPTRTCSAR